MSSIEETNNQLRDLVSRTLKAKGVLSNVQAQIRASVFLALEENNDSKDSSPFLNSKLKDFINTSEGVLALSLIKEFLQFFNLEYTMAVFEPEISCGLNVEYHNREEIFEKLNLISNDAGEPLLSLLLKSMGDKSPSESSATKSSPADSNEDGGGQKGTDLLSFDLLNNSPNEVSSGQTANSRRSLGSLPFPSQKRVLENNSQSKSDKPSNDVSTEDGTDLKSKGEDLSTESEIEEDISEVSISGEGSASSVDISLSKLGKRPN